jgi:hypothetical protein
MPWAVAADGADLADPDDEGLGFIAPAGGGGIGGAELSGDDLYADDLNFHHFKQFRINPIIHEKRGIVGFSKTRRRDTTNAVAQWVRYHARGP